MIKIQGDVYVGHDVVCNHESPYASEGDIVFGDDVTVDGIVYSMAKKVEGQNWIPGSFFATGDITAEDFIVVSPSRTKTCFNYDYGFGFDPEDPETDERPY